MSERKQLFFIGELAVRGETVEDLKRELGDAEAVELIIDSPGGNASYALDVLEVLANRDVTARITGKAMSAAAILAMAARRIEIASSGRMMLHSPAEYVFGNCGDLALGLKRLRKCVDKVHDLLVWRTGQSVATVAQWLTAGDHYFTATEALAAGLADAIFEPAPAQVKLTAHELAATQADARHTAEEKLFHEFLRAFGPLPVRSRHAFGRELSAWFSTVQEEA